MTSSRPVVNAEASTWDAVIVGTGIGGATLGYALAKAGRRVLFVERGLDLRTRAGDGIYDRFVEADPGFRRLSEAERRHKIALGGRSTDRIDDRGSGSRAGFTPFIGCGTGGSSALYGTVLERLFPVDFVRGATHPGDGGSSLPDAWPISYQDLQPWYESAERLYRVRGGADPFRPGEEEALLPAPALSAESAEIFATLSGQGLHPYRLHTACDQADRCRTCQGYLCGSGGKNEAAAVCLSPATEKHGAGLLTECAALFLEADRSKVQRLVCSWRGRRIELRATIFVLAAGALLTPALLLNSKSASWPRGLANASGLVGGNLMRHAIDLYVLTRAPRLREDALTKELAFNDFYAGEPEKFGTVQSFGTPSPLEYLRNRPGFNLWRLLGPVAPYLGRTYGRQPILGAIMEDLPYARNRVAPEGAISENGRYRLSLRYRSGPGDVARRRRFRTTLARVLAPFGPRRAWGTTDRPALGHACGTCRFGADPEISVLDPWNRAHGVANLYVVDASFFPTSGGLNPALTIAANALRVAHHLESAVGVTLAMAAASRPRVTMGAPQNMTLVTLADERYALTLAVLGRSLSENSRSGRCATLYVVDGGITRETKRRLIASWDSERIRVEFVPPRFGEERELPVWGRLPPLTYARVFVPLLVPEECGKAIMLDSDVVVQADIEGLWNVGLGDRCVLAVQDPAVPFVSSRSGLRRYRELGIPAGHPYFNAGVMVINVEKWRRIDVSRKVMEFIRGNANELNYCDQDGLNAILWDDWGALDSRWQVQPRLAGRMRLPMPQFDDGTRERLTADPWILHFSGRLKPWMYRDGRLADRLFYEYLDRTWWSGWRPPSSVKAWMYRLYDSGLRDWCYPVEQWGHAVMRKLSRRSVRV